MSIFFGIKIMSLSVYREAEVKVKKHKAYGLKKTNEILTPAYDSRHTGQKSLDVYCLPRVSKTNMTTLPNMTESGLTDRLVRVDPKARALSG